MKVYKKFNSKNNSLKKTNDKSKEIFSLPLYPELTISEVNQISKVLKDILKKINK